MGNSVSTNACLDVEDLQESTEVALAVVQSLEPAHTPPQDDDANYLRQCLKCGNVSYLRQGVCLSPQCTDSYLSLPADEVGRRLQSWGKEDSTTKASNEQMEESRKKRLARDDWSGSSYKRSKGRKHTAWSASFRKGVHPRTGKEGMDKPVWWKGEYWIFQPKQGWVRTIQDADPAAEPKAAEPKAAEPKASGKAPELSKEAQLRLQEAREAQAERLEEQERRRHAAEANIGLPTSAKPPVAKKETLVQLYQSASPEGKQLAYNAMAKALAKEPTVPKTETPVKAMPLLPPWRQPPLPPAFQNVFAEHMAQQLPGMLAHALGLPMPPPAKAVNLVIYGNPGPKMLPSVPVPKPKAPLPGDVNEMPGDVNDIAGDTTEEEGEEATRDDLFDRDWMAQSSNLPAWDGQWLQLQKKSLKLLCRRQHGNPWWAFHPTLV